MYSTSSTDADGARRLGCGDTNSEVCDALKDQCKLSHGRYNRGVKVTIVGGGIIGCAVAHALTSRGAAVRIVDMRGAGRGATQASAGILAPYIEGHIEALLQLGVSSLALYDEFVARVSADARQPIEYERSGSLHVARNEAAAMELAIAARRFAHAGVAHELMPPHEAHEPIAMMAAAPAAASRT